MAMAGGGRRRSPSRRHLVVQAGTGTGKSLAYLIPAALSGRAGGGGHGHQGPPGPAGRQGPAALVAAAIDRDFSFAVLKGRSNYLCRSGSPRSAAAASS